MVGESVAFQLIQPSGVEPTEIAWTITGPANFDFKGEAIEVTFPTQGDYTVMVKVAAQDGQFATAEKVISVKERPSPTTPSEAEEPQEFTLVLAKATLLEDHGLGSDWEFICSLDGEEIPFSLESLPVSIYTGAPKSLVLKLKVIEHDEAIDDVAEAELELGEAWEPGSSELEVTVYEDGKEDAEAYARWQFELQTTLLLASPERPTETHPSPQQLPTDSSSTSEDETQSSVETCWDLFASFSLPILGFSVIAAGDINGDGLADLAVGKVYSSSVSLFQGVGTGEFSKVSSYSLGLVPDRILLADFNGDARGDLVAVNWTNRRATLLLGQGNFGFSSPIPLGMPATAWNVLVAQLNANIGAELVWLTQDGPVVWSLTRQGVVIQWKSAPPSLSFVMLPPAPYVWGDLNLDGNLEIAYYSANPGEVFILSKTGEHLAFAETPEHVPLIQLEVADVDGDGLPDLLGLDRLGNVYMWGSNGD